MYKHSDQKNKEQLCQETVNIAPKGLIQSFIRRLKVYKKIQNTKSNINIEFHNKKTDYNVAIGKQRSYQSFTVR